MVAVFWGSVLVIVQTYVVFPVVVLTRGRFRSRPHETGEVTPSISIVVAAHDEETTIGPKLASVVAGEYPSALTEIVVASDGSTDGTVESAQAVDGRVRVLDLARVGKAAALNEAIAHSRGEIIVFTDANSLFRSDTLRALVRPFADPQVGGVAGDQRYVSASAPVASTADGERRYWDLDRVLKRAESAGGNVIGATGALYAVRRELVGTIADGVTDDFTTSAGVIEQGRRLVFAADAAVYEPVAASADAEFRRKVRVMTRGLQGVMLRRRLLDPRRHGFYAYQLGNHKVLRRLMGIPLMSLFVASLGCAHRGRVFRVALLGQLSLYGTASVALARPEGLVGRSRVGGLAGYFCLVNAAGLVAAWNIVTGRRIDRWEPERAPTPGSSPGDRIAA